MLEGIVLFGIDSMKMLQDKIRERIKEVPEGTWIQGGSWIESNLKKIEHLIAMIWTLLLLIMLLYWKEYLALVL